MNMRRTGYHVLALLFLAIAWMMTSRAALAGRDCQANFSESGDWQSGKTFKSFIEVQGDPAKVFQLVGQKIASEGFAGINASKDLGVVNAYQDNKGKHSPLNAVITDGQPGRVRVEVVFQLAAGLNAPTSAAKDELCKILEAALPAELRAAAAAAAASESGITLRSKTGELPLAMAAGEVRKSGFMPVLKIYSDIVGDRATVRTNEGRPTLVVREPDDPAKKYVLVELESDSAGNRRSLKMMSGLKLLKAGFTGKVDYAPDKDSTIPFTTQQEGTGSWRLSPNASLEPGEYGVWDLKGMALAAFGVDK
jgi:hypothetical protein